MRNVIKRAVTENPILVTGVGICPIIFAGVSLRLGLFTSALFLVCAVVSAIVCKLAGKNFPKFMRIVIIFAVNGIVLLILRQISVRVFTDLTDSLGVFLILLSVNWLIFSLASIAHRLSLKEAILLGLKTGGLFAVVMMIVSVLRQFIATGSILNLDIFHTGGIFIPAAALPFAGFLILGLVAALANFISQKLKTADENAEVAKHD